MQFKFDRGVPTVVAGLTGVVDAGLGYECIP